GAAAASGPADPPPPPPVRVDTPAGSRPGPAPGLRRPERCTPPPADPATAPTGPDAPGSARMQLAKVHRLATGRGQLIAVIDTGVFPHRLLGDRLRGGGDYLTGGDGLDDCDGHGTAVAGLLGAAPAPGRDGRAPTPIGIAPAAELLAIRQSSPSFEVPAPDGGLRPAGDTDTLADAVVLAVRGGADVVNISEAVCLSPDRAAVAGASLHAALRYAAAADVVVVAAAGNAGPLSCAAPGPEQVALPGWYDAEILTVGAVGPDDAPAPFTVPGPWVDVAAPGIGLRSLAVGGGTTGSGLDGTSFAAPWVAGLAALVRERFPDLTAEQVVDRILATARRPAGGHSAALGHGVIDPVAALTAVPAVLEPAPEGTVGVRTAELPGTAPRAARSESPWPVDVLAVALLALASGATATLLRRRPARPRRVP
uniref:type VII secretion-associated serine protease mycosin n=1 Tax=Pseudonocardia nigra TaxID=1921578 RepID=UPI001C5F8977